VIPGGGTLSGVSPHWIGDLTPADFRPDVPCSTQRVPGLAVVGSTAPDLGAGRRAASTAPAVGAGRRAAPTAPAVSAKALRAALARAEGRGWHLARGGPR
jgi:hypothetical protein